MHLKRDVGNPAASVSAAPVIASPTTPPPIPSKPMVDSAPIAQPVAPQKSAPASSSPFSNVASSKASKLVALEASGAKSYALVSSPTVWVDEMSFPLKFLLKNDFKWFIS